MSDVWDDEELIDFHNELLNNADDSWDQDVAQPEVILGYVRHLEAEVMRLGGCARSFCHWDDGEPCDHGYLKTPVAVIMLSDFSGRLHPFPLPPSSAS